MLLMRQPVSKHPIQVSAKDSTNNDNKNGGDTVAQQSKERTWAGTGHGPTESKNDASEKITWNTHILRVYADL